MIQRIQTIWLIISAILSGFLFKGGIINLIDKAGQKYYTGFSGISKLNEAGSEVITRSVPLSALIILIPLLSVITILMFKSRRIQKILSLIIVTFSVCLIILVIYYSSVIMTNYAAELVPGLKMIIPPIILIAGILAFRGISGDDNLVKSYDRLR
jgi:hypothetical protein